MPNPGGGTVVLDVGANAECKAGYLVQFAHMGSVYARYLLGRENPRVGLLSIGEEDTKGNSLVLEALPLLRRARHLNFIGNVEGRDVFKGTCDVVVTDGFTGNVVLKTAESVASLLAHKVREELKRDLLARLGALLMLPALQPAQARDRLGGVRRGAAARPRTACASSATAAAARARSAARSAPSRRFVEQRVNEHIREEIQADHVTAA